MGKYIEKIKRIIGIKEKENVTDDSSLYKNRNVLVGVVKNKRQFNVLLKRKFYHIPMSQLADCSFPIEYVAIYQSKKLFGKESGIRAYGIVKDTITLPRNQILEIPSLSDEKYLYIKVKGWYKLAKTIKADDMDTVAFSTSEYLLRNAKTSSELRITSKEEHELYILLVNRIKKLVRTHTPDGEDIVFRDYTIKLKGGLLYLYFGEVIEYIIGYDVFLEKPMAVIRDIFNYYPEI